MLTSSAVLALVLLGQSSVVVSPDAAPVEQTQAPAPRPPDSDNQKADAKEPPTPPYTGFRALFGNLGEDVKRLPSRQNLYLAVIGGALRTIADPGQRWCEPMQVRAVACCSSG